MLRNSFFSFFFLVYWLFYFDRAKKIPPSTAPTLQEVQGRSSSPQRAGSHHLSVGAAEEPGWFYPISSLGFPARGAVGLVCSQALPTSQVHFWSRETEQAKLQPQQNPNCRCACGAVRATWGAAFLEGCVLAEQW